MDQSIRAGRAAARPSSRWVTRFAHAALAAAVATAVVMLLALAGAVLDAGLAVFPWDVVDLGR